MTDAGERPPDRLPEWWPELPERLKDAAYVAVGLAVLGFQRAQVRRRELEKALRQAVQSAVADRDGSGG